MNPSTTISKATQTDVPAQNIVVSSKTQKLPTQIASDMSVDEKLHLPVLVVEGVKLPTIKPEKITKKLKNHNDSGDSDLSFPSAAQAEQGMDSSLVLAQASTETKVISDAGGGANAASSSVASDSAASAPVTGAGAASTGGSVLGIIGGVAVLGAAAGSGGNSGGVSVTAVPVVNAVNPVVNATTKASGLTVTGTAEAGATVTVNWGSSHKTATAATNGAWSLNFAAADIPADGATTLSAVAKKSGSTDSQPSANVAITVDTTGPTLISSVADSATQKITLTYSEALDVVVDHNLPSAFTVSIAGQTNIVDSVTVVGSTVVLSMHNAIPSSGAVSVVYRDPTTGDDPAAIQDAAGNDAGGFTTAVVADGYIRGAKVYIDNNNNGVVDAADTLIGTTDKNGNIVIPDKLAGGTLLVEGGVNIDTGVPNTTTLKAPQGSTSITPLTTLVQTVVEQQVAANPGTVVDATVVQAAMTKVATALGLTGSLDGKSLLTFDPIAENNTYVQKAAAQVATIVALASNGDATKSAEVIGNLTTKIANNGSGPTIALENATVLNSILPSSLTTDQKAVLTTEISTASNYIKSASTIDGISNAQGQSLDKTATAKPTLDVATLTNKPAELAVKVLLENKATDGTAVITGDTIQLKDGAVVVGSPAIVTVDDLAAGFKIIKLNFAGADDSTHNLTATITDKANNVSHASAVAAVKVDTVVAAPVVAAVSTDNIVNATEKTAGVDVSGTAEAGASVVVTWGAKTKPVTATGGNWTANFTSAELPADGSSTTVSAVATDLAGNVSTAGTKSVAIDSVQPTVTATIQTVQDNVPATAVTDVAKGATTNDNTPTLVGTLSAALGTGEVLAVFDGTSRLGTATVSNTTSWSYTSTSMANGDHSLTVVAEDSAGNQGVVSSAYAFKVDATVPAATAAVTAFPAAVTTVQPVISGTITGTIASGDLVKVFVDNSFLGNATVSGSTWTLTPSAALTQGQHKITAVVENAGGTQSALSAEKAFTVDTLAPAVPVLSSFSDNSGLTTDNITNDKTITFSMTAEAGSKLEVFSGTTSLGLATESSTAGTFSFTTASLADGTYRIKAVSSDAAGNSTASAVKDLVIDATAPAKSVITDWVNTGSNINLVIAAETGTQVTVSKGSVVLGTATETSTKGIYNYAAPLESSGNYAFTTTAKDVAANVSDSNTQAAIFVSGDSLQTTTAGSLDMKVLSSTSSGLSLGLYPKFTNTGLGTAEVNLKIDTSKVTFPDAVTSELTTLTLLPGTSNPDATTIDIFTMAGFNSNFTASPVNSTTAFAMFTLNWVSTPKVLNFEVSSMQFDPPEGSTYSGLVNPSFSFTPGNGVATGTTGDDLIITGTGNVSVTGGAGADTVLLGSSAVNLTLTDFVFGTDHIDVSKLMSGTGYTSTGSTAAANVAVMMSTAPTNIAALITSKDISLDNKFGAWFEAATTGTNKGVLHLLGDTDAAVGTGHVAPSQIDIVIGANSSGTFSVTDLTYHLASAQVI